MSLPRGFRCYLCQNGRTSTSSHGTQESECPLCRMMVNYLQQARPMHLRQGIQRLKSLSTAALSPSQTSSSSSSSSRRIGLFGCRPSIKDRLHLHMISKRLRSDASLRPSQTQTQARNGSHHHHNHNHHHHHHRRTSQSQLQATTTTTSSSQSQVMGLTQPSIALPSALVEWARTRRPTLAVHRPPGMPSWKARLRWSWQWRTIVNQTRLCEAPPVSPLRLVIRMPVHVYHSIRHRLPQYVYLYCARLYPNRPIASIRVIIFPPDQA